MLRSEPSPYDARVASSRASGYIIFKAPPVASIVEFVESVLLVVLVVLVMLVMPVLEGPKCPALSLL